MTMFSSYQYKSTKTLLSILTLFLAAIIFPNFVAAQVESVTAIVKVSANTDINQLAADYNAVITGEIPALAQVRFQASNPNLLTQLAADYRVVSVETAVMMDARPIWIDAVGQDILSPSGGPFVATPSAPAEYTAQWAAQLIRTEQAHTIATGATITVAILDTGIDLDHPWLAGKLVPGYDFVGGDSNPAEEANSLDSDGDLIPDEAAGHGTHVAGIVALTAPDANLMPIRIFDSDGVGQYFDIAQGIIYATNHGADIINLSGSGSYDISYLQDAVAYAQANGVVVVVAGGLTVLDYPASYNGVISVGATDSADYVQPFAVYGGDSVTVYAPGASIFSAYYDNSGVAWSGNSMATPFAAGGAALLLSTGTCNADCVYDTISQAHNPAWRDGQAIGRRLDLVDMLTAVSPTTPDLSVSYRSNPADSATDDSVQPFLQIHNNKQTVALSDLTLRYWYHTETAVSELFHCDYATIGCGGLIGSFGSLNDVVGTNRYFELGFAADAGYLYGGTQIDDLMLRFNQTNHAPYDETTHYSRPTTSETYTEWETITLYYQGNLVWGIEPGTAVPESAPPPPPPPACSLPAWAATQVYTGGDVVLYNGRSYQAKWWTLNEIPGAAAWGPWQDLGAC